MSLRLPLLLRLGWRNVWRNTRRSLITIGALGFSLGIMVIFMALMEGNMVEMIDRITGLTVGDLQIHHRLFPSDQNLYQTVADTPRLLGRLQEQGLRAAPRWYGYGLVSAERTGKSAGVRIQGLDLQAEPTVTEIHLPEYYHLGHALTGAVGSWSPPPPEDLGPAPADPLSGGYEREESAEPLIVSEAVIGRKLAAALQAAPGDRVTLVTMAADGSLGNEVFEVVGILKPMDETTDRTLVLTDAAAFQRLFSLRPGECHEIAIRASEGASLAATKAAIHPLLGPNEQVRAWQEILPAAADILQVWGSLIWLMLVVMYLGGALVVLNSLLMMVFERLAEFGVLKALGVRPVQLVGLIYAETLWLCLVSAAAGLAVGVPVSLWLETTGINLSAFAPGGFQFAGTMIDPVLYTVVGFSAIRDPVLALFGISAVAVLYPALKAALIEPIEALNAV